MSLNENSQKFIELALERGVLKFGQFTLKSGRVSPYFFNAGQLDTGFAMWQTAHCYAQVLESSTVQYDMLFGPAYKGIPLATALACALNERNKMDIPVAFNRKEAKKHGEGGSLIGAALKGRVLIIDDVMSAGTAVNESIQLIESQGAELAGVVIGLDRQERGLESDLSALQEVESKYAVPVLAVSTLADLLFFAKQNEALQDHAKAISQYRDRFGVL